MKFKLNLDILLVFCTVRMQFFYVMAFYGMGHQSTCPHTPLQNGVAERKQCHIIEKACTLSIHAIAPTNFEGDDILGDGYLINRMSLSSINDEVPRLFYFLMKFSLRFLLVFFILLVLYKILLQVLIS